MLARRLASAQRIAGGMAGVGCIHIPIWQVLVAPGRYAQARGLHQHRRALADILDKKTLGIEMPCVPFRHF
jgi:hypothetical protein